MRHELSTAVLLTHNAPPVFRRRNASSDVLNPVQVSCKDHWIIEVHQQAGNVFTTLATISLERGNMVY